MSEVERLALGDEQGYPSFYGLTNAEARFPLSEIDRVRGAVDEILFPGYKAAIRFGALTITGAAPTGYGDCALVLRESFISDRATVFHTNSLRWAKEANLGPFATELPQGARASWSARADLGCVKLEPSLTPGCFEPDTLQRLLIRDAGDMFGDDFVEVHVFGPITIRSVERISFERAALDKRSAAEYIDLTDSLTRNGIAVEVRRGVSK